MIKHEEANLSQRRFPRVFLTGVMREFSFIKNCDVIWPSKFASGIYDVGRSSVTLYFPMRLNLQFIKGDLVKLGFKIGKEADAIFTDCRVIRAETRLLVIELLRVSRSQSESIANYFTDDVISQNTHYIEPRFYAPEQTFSYWFHGPRDTNLYIWKHDKGIQRIVLELGTFVYEWNSKGMSVGASRDSLSYATEDYAYYSNNLVPSKSMEPKSDDALKFRYFVSTLTSLHPVIKDVSNCLG